MVEQGPKSVKEPAERKKPATFAIIETALQAVSKRASKRHKDLLTNEDTIADVGPKFLMAGLSTEHIVLVAERVTILASDAKKQDPTSKVADRALAWANSVPEKLESGEWLKEAARRRREAEPYWY